MMDSTNSSLSRITEVHTLLLDPEYLGSSYNLLIEWETGEMTWESLSDVIDDDPYSCAVYAKKFDLLNTQGWKQLKICTRAAKRLIRTPKKSKYRQAMASKRYKNGWEVPRDCTHALHLMFRSKNKWRDALDLEIEQIKQYQVFKVHGKAVYEKNKVINAPKEYQKVEYILCLMLNITGNSRQDLWQRDISPKNPMKLSIQELFPGGTSD